MKSEATQLLRPRQTKPTWNVVEYSTKSLNKSGCGIKNHWCKIRSFHKGATLVNAVNLSPKLTQGELTPKENFSPSILFWISQKHQIISSYRNKSGGR